MPAAMLPTALSSYWHSACLCMAYSTQLLLAFCMPVHGFSSCWHSACPCVAYSTQKPNKYFGFCMPVHGPQHSAPVGLLGAFAWPTALSSYWLAACLCMVHTIRLLLACCMPVHGPQNSAPVGLLHACAWPTELTSYLPSACGLQNPASRPAVPQCCVALQPACTRGQPSSGRARWGRQHWQWPQPAATSSAAVPQIQAQRQRAHQQIQ
jgi:hypothetical protein